MPRTLEGKNHLRSFLIILACAIWLAVLGWIDRATGYELDLFAFYTAPVGVVAWQAGQGLGIVVAFIASIVWYMADRFAGDRYSSPFYAYWNTGMHFSSFIINAVTVAKIKWNLDRRKHAERALAEAEAKLKAAHLSRRAEAPPAEATRPTSESPSEPLVSAPPSALVASE